MLTKYKRDFQIQLSKMEYNQEQAEYNTCSSKSFISVLSLGCLLAIVIFILFNIVKLFEKFTLFK